MNKLPKISTQTSSKGFSLLICPIFQDSKKKPKLPDSTLSSQWARFEKLGNFEGKPKQVEIVLFQSHQQFDHLAWIGLGLPAKTDENSYELGCWWDQIRQSGAMLYRKMKHLKIAKAALTVDSWKKHSPSKAENEIQAFLEGWSMAGYEFEKHRGKKALEEKRQFSFYPEEIALISSEAKWKSVAMEVNAITEAITVTRDWSNEPSNFGYPEAYAKEAKKLAVKYGLKCKIMNDAEAKKEKMGLYLGVGQGSDRENRMVILEYRPQKPSKSSKHVMFVGKGVTFDSGGISLKPSPKMEEMKHDMTGAATMMGAVILAAKKKVPNRVTTILAFAENMPSGKAIQPGNVLTSRSGKTVEVINTDAEGRLVLADAIDYGHRYKPDVIVDAATLTGAVGIALGKHCTALMTNHSGVGELFEEIGYRNWERFWQLPTFSDYEKDIQSPVADLRNSTNDRLAGTITAGMFLKQFIQEGVKWAHLDIAFTSYDRGTVPYFPRNGATGAVVRSLAEFAEKF